MGTYNNLNKKAKTIVDIGLVLGIGPLAFEKTRNYLSKLYLLQDEFYGMNIMKSK